VTASGRRAAPIAAVPGVLGLLAAWQTVALGGVRVARGHGPSSATAGWVVAGGFFVVALLWLLVTGFVEKLTVARRRGVVTHGVGLFVPWRVREWPLRSVERLEVQEGGTPDEPVYRILLVGPGVSVAGFRTYESASALAGRLSSAGCGVAPAGGRADRRSLGLVGEQPTGRREETKEGRRTRREVEVEVEVSLSDGTVRVLVGGRSASWRQVDAPRGRLHALTPGRSGGEVALLTVGPDGQVETRLLWPRFDGAVWSALCAEREALAAAFPEGLEVVEQADA